jgi:hypothetical protein
MPPNRQNQEAKRRTKKNKLNATVLSEHGSTLCHCLFFFCQLMLSQTLLTACLLGSLFPFVSSAQTTSVASRFYVGVGGNQLSNIPFNDAIVPRFIGPSLTAGMQLTPRLAVQTGLSYHWGENSPKIQQLIDSPSSTHSGYFIIPALLRFTTTAPAARAHFDIVGGATLVHIRNRTTYDYNGSTLKELRNSNTQFSLTLGPAVRAALAPNLEITAASVVSAVVGESYYQFSERLFLNTSIGVNYTFGQH